jgi:dephospho-CoA kinase
MPENVTRRDFIKSTTAGAAAISAVRLVPAHITVATAVQTMRATIIPACIGLTGSIGTGKSTTARMFADCGIPVSDADAIVHALYSKGGAAVGAIAEAFPGVDADGAIDRAKLASILVDNAPAFETLEAIVHPLVRQAQKDFLAKAMTGRARAAILEVPLLFETAGDQRCDVVVVTSANAAIQRKRVLARPGMSSEKFDAILARQMSDEEKRHRAHFIVDTGFGMDAARAQVCDIINAIAPMPGRTDKEILDCFESKSM